MVMESDNTKKYRRTRNTNRFETETFGDAKEGVTAHSRRTLRVPVKTWGNGSTSCDARGQASAPTPPLRKPEPVTTIAIRADVGFGNALYIRGQGEGLTWEKGQPLVCVDGATWVWSHRPATEPVIFKVLINDQLWCHGENLQVAAGTNLEIAPSF